MPQRQTSINDLQGALFTLRLIWIAMLMSQVSLLILSVFVNDKINQEPQTLEAIMPLFGASLAFLLIGVPVGMFVRNQMYKRYWQQDVIKPQGYFQGNLIFLAICEAAGLFGMVVVVVQHTFSWPLVVPVLAMAVQVINFPNGKAMQPHPMTDTIRPEENPGDKTS